MANPLSSQCTAALTERQRLLTHLLAAQVAIEYIRITSPEDSRQAAAYAAMVLDNCRAVAPGDARAYLRHVRAHARWLRSLPVDAPLAFSSSGGTRAGRH